jgi:LacI family gluconate utilization system Gnt-I transcriptional repressor
MAGKSPIKASKRSSGRVTIQDIAARAKVSAMTVSRALKNSPSVSVELRERIKAIASKSGYVVHHAARTLASSRSRLIGVLVPSFSNEVFVDVLAGIRDCLQPQGYQMMVGDTLYSPAIEERMFRTYLEHMPDGFLMTGFDCTKSIKSISDANSIPLVHMMDLSPRHMSVGFSQQDAGHAMGRYLVGRGYRNLTYIAGQLDPRVLKRREGFRRAIAEAGPTHHYHEVMVPDPSSVGLGAKLLGHVLDLVPQCDAIFACNDDLAAGVLFECQRRGIKVPDALAVAGFNDLTYCAWTSPTITSITTPRYQVGFEAAQLLLKVLNKGKPARTRIDLGFRLTERQST